MSDLATLAERMGFPTLAKLLRAADLPEPAALDAVLSRPIPTDTIPALQLMPRRGLDPRLVETTRRWLADRPLELGLFSWDVLAGSIVESPELLSSLRAAARVVRDVLPPPGERHCKLDRVSSREMVERLSAPGLHDLPLEKLLEAAYRRSLDAMSELQRRGLDDKMVSTGFLSTTHTWATSLSSMHLPTLSNFYLDFLWTGLHHRPALADLCEVLLDAGAVDSSTRARAAPHRRLRRGARSHGLRRRPARHRRKPH